MEKSTPVFEILLGWIPMLLLIGVWVYFMRQMKGKGSYGSRQDQILNEYTRHNELLTTVIERFKGQSIAGTITLTKGERSILAELASNLL